MLRLAHGEITVNTQLLSIVRCLLDTTLWKPDVVRRMEIRGVTLEDTLKPVWRGFTVFLTGCSAFYSFDYAVESIKEKLKATPLVLQVIG